MLNTPELDTSLPGRKYNVGYRHPISSMIDDLVRLFNDIGFTTVDGPEVDNEMYNFDVLNVPRNHPSRGESDTFYVDRPISPSGRSLLRTHTSNVQHMIMKQSQTFPIRIISVGKCYRRDAVDSTHFPMFHQIEGFCVDENISMADLKSVLLYLAKHLFGSTTEVRLRPSYFPFTVPSVEVDAKCVICGGTGCSVCHNEGWIELGGAGMVHPNVLAVGGIDPTKYSGFAFGFGIERLLMIKYGITDIRMFYENDVRFLEKFNKVGDKNVV